MGLGGFRLGFPGGNLRIDAPGDDGWKDINKHVNQADLTKIRGEYREDDDKAAKIIKPKLKIPQKRAQSDASLTAWEKITKPDITSKAAAGVGMPLKNPGIGDLSSVK